MVLQPSHRLTEGDQADVEITAEIPAPVDGTVAIKCSWEDLLDYYDHQNQLGYRTSVTTRLESTKEFFKNKLLGTNSQRQFKAPSTVGVGKGSKETARIGKHVFYFYKCPGSLPWH